MERAKSFLSLLSNLAREAPVAAAVVAGVLLAFVLAVFMAWLRRSRRRSRMVAYVCEQNRQAIADALHSHCLRLRGRKEPSFDLEALCRGGGLDAKKARCRGGGRYSALFGEAAAKGAVPPILVRCSRHGDTRLVD